MAGDAWPSSVRGLNCTVKSGNERNPYCLLQVSGKTALFLEEGGDDARSVFPSDALGGTRATMGTTTGRDGVTLS